MTDRETDDNAPLIVANIPLPKDLKIRYHETAKNDMKPETKRDYRNRLRNLIINLEEDSEETKAYFDEGTRLVSMNELSDPTKYYFNNKKIQRDFKYTGMHDQFILHLFTKIKFKPNGKLKSHVDMQKYKDAILWGANTANEALPSQVHTTLESFLNGYKKELQVAKKEGNLDESSADPIPFVLYKLILKWASESNSIFVWFWTLTQWNMVGRCANVEPLRFANFSLGSDSIVGKYDDSKAVKDAERLAEKNIYANPYNWMMCFWTDWEFMCHWRKINLQTRIQAYF